MRLETIVRIQRVGMKVSSLISLMDSAHVGMAEDSTADACNT